MCGRVRIPFVFCILYLVVRGDNFLDFFLTKNLLVWFYFRELVREIFSNWLLRLETENSEEVKISWGTCDGEELTLAHTRAQEKN